MKVSQSDLCVHRVLCVGKGWGITIGKWYNVIGEENAYYKLIDEHGDLSWWKKVYFKTQAEVREDKLRELGI